MQKIIAIIESLVKLRFTGKLEITFFEGGIRAVHEVRKVL